jgi:F-type H+-transporting ATPase subunit b
VSFVSSAFAQTAPELAPGAGDMIAAPAAPDTQATTAAPAGKHAGGHETFPPFDPTTFGSQLFWLVIAFGGLYLLMKRVAVPRIGGILEDRANRIAGDLTEAGRMKTESEAAVAAYEKALAEARQNAHQIGAKARDAAKARVDADRRKTEGALNDKLSAAESEIAKVKAAALAGVDAIAKDAVETMVEVLVGAKVGKDEVARAVEAVIAEGASR